MGRDRRFLGQLVKFPVPGEVKTRLGEEIGFGRAAALYRIVAERVIRATEPAGKTYERVIFFAPVWMRREFGDWLPTEVFIPQRGEDLGEVMKNAIGDLLTFGASRAVITGVDIPELTGEVICDAFDILEDSDVVIGPAEDGGYYLIGMSTVYPELFQDMPWGTGSVCEETMKRVSAMGLHARTLPVLRDMDRAADLRDAAMDRLMYGGE